VTSGSGWSGPLAVLCAKLGSHPQVAAQLSVQGVSWDRSGQFDRLAQISAGCPVIASQAVEQIAVVEGSWILRERRHHGMTGLQTLAEVGQLQLPQAVIAANGLLW